MTEPPKSEPPRQTATERLLEEAAKLGVPVTEKRSSKRSGFFIARGGFGSKVQRDSRD